MGLLRHKERSKLPIVVTYYDGDNVRVVPTAARYRIDCDTTGNIVSDWVDYTPSGTSDTIEVTPEQNAIIVNSNPNERKVLSVETEPGTDDQVTDTFEWLVVNKRGIT